MKNVALDGSRLLSDALVIQVGRALQTLFNVITFVVLARGMRAEGFGVFSTIVAVLATGYALADLGLGQLATRAVAQRQHDEIQSIGKALPALTVASFVIIIISAALSWILTGLGAQAALTCLLIGLSYVYAQARIGVERGLWLGALNVFKATGIELTAAALRMVGVLSVWAAHGTSVTAYAWAIALSGIGALAIVRRWLTYPIARTETATGRPQPTTIKDALPFALSSLTWNGLTELPKVILAPIAGAIAVAHFAAGGRLLAVAYLPLHSVLNVVTPRLFVAAREPAYAETRGRVFAKSAVLVSLLGAVLAVIIMALAPLLPAIIGKDYSESVPVVRLLVISLPFQALAFASGDWLAGMGRQRFRLMLTAGAFVVAAPLIGLLAHRDGAQGAAVGFVGATALLAIASTLVCWRMFKS